MRGGYGFTAHVWGWEILWCGAEQEFKHRNDHNQGCQVAMQDTPTLPDVEISKAFFLTGPEFCRLSCGVPCEFGGGYLPKP